MTAGEEVSAAAPYTPGPNAIDITRDKDGGVMKEIIKEGEGDGFPASGCTVSVNYEVKLLDGTVVDSYMNPAEPFEFTLGREQVIKGWELCVTTMKKGEEAVLTCQGKYGYGKESTRRGEKARKAQIPVGATMVFRIILRSWEPGDLSKAQDGGILKMRTLVFGKQYARPHGFSIVEVHLTGRYEGRVFEDRDVKFTLGEGCEVGVIEGVEIALEKFTKGEKSILEIKPKYAFKKEGHKEFDIPPNATVEYTVELINFELQRTTWDMTSSEKIEQAKILKEKGTNYFKANKYDMAAKFYKRLLKLVDSSAGFTTEPELNEEREKLLLAVRLNLGLVYFKMGQCYEARAECEEALKLDPQNVKGLFRRGQIYLTMNEPEKAKADFEAVLKIEPTNRLAASEIQACCDKIKQQREGEKKIYANMFEKFARKDKEESITRYGWWDDKKKEPIVAEVQSIALESIEAAKEERRKQLENLKKIAKAKKEEMEREKKEGDQEKEIVKEPEERKSDVDAMEEK